MSGLLIIAVSGLASATASRKSDADARLSYSALVQDITFTVKGGLHEPIMNVTLDGVRQTIVALKAPASDVPGGEFGFVPPRPFGGSHRLGDVTLRVRQVGVASYDTLTTAAAPEAAVPFATVPLPLTLAGHRARRGQRDCDARLGGCRTSADARAALRARL
jgi:hypothetical protein